MGLLPTLLLLACADTPRATEPVPSRARTVGEAPALCINELMPDNDAALILEDDSRPDWIELFNPTDADISLDGWTISDDRTQPDRHPLFAGLVVPAGEPLLLYADEGDGPDHLSFKLSAEGDEVALFDPEGDGTVLAFGVVYDDFAVARVDDCCTGDGCLAHVFRGSPGVANTAPETAEEVLVAAGSDWAYRDDGGPQDAGWTSAVYDDSRWATGPAPLGYGDSQVTVLSFGSDPEDKHITSWFRLEFEAADVDDITALQLGLVRDDGALVWLNGVEVARSNMPTGPITEATVASAAVGDSDETASFGFDIDPGSLAEGTNLLAVEVHQAAGTSSDLTMDLSLTATRLVSD